MPSSSSPSPSPQESYAALPRLGPADFSGQTLDRPGLWAVCFAADWCPYCRAFLPQFAGLAGPEGEAASAGSGGFSLAMGDLTDYDSPLWDDFSVEVIPTLVAFDSGEVVWRREGAPGVGLEARDLEALCHELTGKPCAPEALDPGFRFGSRRPQRGSDRRG